MTRCPIFAALVSLFTPFFTQAEEKWIDLFDGKTTDGWTPRAEVITFEAKN
ncbi:MAG: DUF1080 domain-containing protein, partial [Verrucomicrobiales bacterium]|nr:DUF1080 domain-containing protein [Verrucomicrobiales bacterium]